MNILTNVDLPKELYLSIFVFADDIKITQLLRLVSKTAHIASYDYFKILLRKDIFVYHHYRWYVADEDPRLKLKDPMPDWAFISHGNNADTPNKSMIFKTTVKNLYNTFMYKD